MPSLDPKAHRPTVRQPRQAGTGGSMPESAEARELAAALRASDPMRAAFDVAVRRVVRTERRLGHDLESILATLRSVLRTHVEPSLAAAHGTALRHAVAWFAVSEFHRGD